MPESAPTSLWGMPSMSPSSLPTRTSFGGSVARVIISCGLDPVCPRRPRLQLELRHLLRDRREHLGYADRVLVAVDYRVGTRKLVLERLCARPRAAISRSVFLVTLNSPPTLSSSLRSFDDLGHVHAAVLGEEQGAGPLEPVVKLLDYFLLLPFFPMVFIPPFVSNMYGKSERRKCTCDCLGRPYIRLTGDRHLLSLTLSLFCSGFSHRQDLFLRPGSWFLRWLCP